MSRVRRFALLVLPLMLASVAEADSLIYKKDVGGTDYIHVTPYPVAAQHLNTPWTQAQEDAFMQRYNVVIDAQGSSTSYSGGTYFENEKRSYPDAMLGYIWGIANSNSNSMDKARNHLQGNANYDTGGVGNADFTEMVDYFPSFTIKTQVNKYFYFGQFSQDNGLDYLDRDYAGPYEVAGQKSQMWRGADKWVDDGYVQPEWDGPNSIYNGQAFPDPFRRPNKYYEPGTPGWTAKAHNSWVDIRNTDNLKHMREAAVYLMAEATGNSGNVGRYKNHLRQMATTLYRTGQSEWDSENYWAWSTSPLLNLHDYAEDPDVKHYAKASLDFMMVGGALKYYRGGFGGPTKRDYGGANKVWGAGASHQLWMYFGDSVIDDPNPHKPNGIHPILSAYRPAQAHIGLATKNWGTGQSGGVEMINTKPSYANWADPGAGEISTPETWETLYFGQRFQLGTCVSKWGNGDVGPFKMMVENSARGVDFFVANSGSKFNTKRSDDQVAQYQDKVIWLRPTGAGISDFSFQLPDSAVLDRTSSPGVWYVKFADDETWIALRPINLSYSSAGDAGSSYPEETKVTAGVSGSDYFGFAMEVGEKGGSDGEFADFAAFRSAVEAASLDTSNLASGDVTLHAADGTFLRSVYNTSNDLPEVYRNSPEAYDWTDPDNYALFRSINEAPSAELDGIADGGKFKSGRDITLGALASDTGQRGPVALDWKTGLLTILANDYYFEQRVDPNGEVSWSERAAVADDYLGKVDRVEFYVDDIIVGVDPNGTDGWSLDWQAVPEGSYSLMVKAIDNDTQVAWSAPIDISVLDAGPGDANFDGTVDIGDLGILAGNWQATDATWSMAEFSGDGIVDVGDLGILAAHWQGGAVPEPTTMVLLAAGTSLALLRRRR